MPERTPREIYQILRDARDVLMFLHHEYPDFPYYAYFDGTRLLRNAMTYVDDHLIIEQEV